MSVGVAGKPPRLAVAFCKEMVECFFGLGFFCELLAFVQLLPATVPAILVCVGIVWLAFYVVETSR